MMSAQLSRADLICTRAHCAISPVTPYSPDSNPVPFKVHQGCNWMIGDMFWIHNIALPLQLSEPSSHQCRTFVSQMNGFLHSHFHISCSYWCFPFPMPHVLGFLRWQCPDNSVIYYIAPLTSFDSYLVVTCFVWDVNHL